MTKYVLLLWLIYMLFQKQLRSNYFHTIHIHDVRKSYFRFFSYFVIINTINIVLLSFHDYNFLNYIVINVVYEQQYDSPSKQH